MGSVRVLIECWVGFRVSGWGVHGRRCFFGEALNCSSSFCFLVQDILICNMLTPHALICGISDYFTVPYACGFV